MNFCVATMDANGKIIYSMGVNEHGQPVMRPKSTHPYCYDGFVVYRALPNSEANMTLYSDRLRSHHMKEWSELSKKYFGDDGDSFEGRCPNAIQKFLAEVTNKPNLKIVFIMEYCNRSNGYPVWRFDVKY